MDERERVHYEVRTGKHPAACTCVVCDEKRRLGPEGLRVRRAEAEKIRRASAGGDYHGVLGVKPGTPAKAITSRYRDLAKRWHSDIYRQDGGETMRLINAAYEVLSNPARREAHERAQTEEQGKQRRYEEWQQSQRQRQAEWSWSQWYREAQEQAERERQNAWQAWREQAARQRQEHERIKAEEQRRRERQQHAAWVKRQERARRREERWMRLSALKHQAVHTVPQAIPAFAVGYAVGLLVVFRALPDGLQRLLRLGGILP